MAIKPSPQFLYHGTLSELSPGSQVDPTWEDNGKKYTFATTDPANALDLAETRAEFSEKEGQTPRVYKVTPSGDPAMQKGNELRYTDPLTVNREVSKPVLDRYMRMRFNGKTPDLDELRGHTG
jgi:hypothetical protein